MENSTEPTKGFGTPSELYLHDFLLLTLLNFNAMLVYILLSVYLIILYASVRSADTVDDQEIVMVPAEPIRPLEWARAIGLILFFVGAIALTKHLLS